MSAMNAASRPNACEKMPPIPAPTASITPQLLPNKAFAWRSSSGSRAKFGIAASSAGRTNAASAAIEPWATNAIQIRESPISKKLAAAIA